MIRHAEHLIIAHVGSIFKHSGYYGTQPWGMLDQPDFINAVIGVHTPHSLDCLLDQTQWIERYMGKSKKEKYGPRIIDVDILFYNAEKVKNKFLTVPHDKLHERNFVLIPLAAIAPDLIHPEFNKSVSQLLKECTDQSQVVKVA